MGIKIIINNRKCKVNGITPSFNTISMFDDKIYNTITNIFLFCIIFDFNVGGIKLMFNFAISFNEKNKYTLNEILLFLTEALRFDRSARLNLFVHQSRETKLKQIPTAALSLYQKKINLLFLFIKSFI